MSKSKQTKPPADEYSLAGRIRIGMAMQGIKSTAELARRLKLNRQTVHRWTSGNVEKLEPEMLFSLSDTLELSPRWLALHKGPIAQKREITEELQRLIDIHNNLAEATRCAWVLSGETLLSMQKIPSRAQPFKQISNKN